MIIKSVILQWILLRYNAKATSTGGLRVSHVLSAHHYTGSARYMRVGLPSYLINATFIMILKVASAIALTAFTVMPHEPLPNLAIGSPMPAADVKMKDVGGKDLSLTDIMGKNGLLVVFSCNTCPFVIGSEGSEGWEGRYPELAAYSQRYGVGIVFVNSNEAKRDDGDGFADMQARYKEKKYSGSYVLDAGNAVADAFGARTTPHVFLFDKDMKLAYKGAIDDNVGSASGVKRALCAERDRATCGRQGHRSGHHAQHRLQHQARCRGAHPLIRIMEQRRILRRVRRCAYRSCIRNGPCPRCSVGPNGCNDAHAPGCFLNEMRRIC